MSPAPSPLTVPSLDALAADPGLAASVSPEAGWALYQQALTAMLSLLPVLRLPAGRGEGDADAEDPLLTIPEVAARLGVKPGRVSELIRSGQLPCVNVGKYRRVRPATLRAWLAEHEANGLYTAYNTGYDGRGTPAPPRTARVDASRARRSPRPPLEHRGPAGAQRAPNPGAGRAARPAARGGPRPAPDDASDETQW